MKAIRNLKRSEKGFTLIEIMIVVLIIGILLAIAVPNFMKARETARAKSCITNLKQIASAKEQWAMDTSQAPTATPTWADLKGPTGFIKAADSNALICPGGGAYTVGAMNVDVACSLSTGTPPHVVP